MTTVKAASAAIILLSLFFCSRVNAEVEQPIVAGANLAITGKLAFYGVEQQHGLELAVDEVNKDGGIKGRLLKLIVEDNGGEAAKAVSAAQKLIHTDKADVIVSAFTHIAGSINDLIRKNGRIHIYASTFREFAKNNPQTFRDYLDNRVGSVAIAKAMKQEKVSSYALITEVSEACSEIVKMVNEEAKSLGLTPSQQEEYNPGDSDMKAQLLKIKQSKPDAVFACAWRDSALIVRQMNELGMIGLRSFHWFAPFVPINDTESARALFQENKAISTWYVLEEPANPLQQTFNKNYETKYGYPPRPGAAYAYDDIKALAKAMNTCANENFSAECVATKYSLTDHDGAAGKLSFDQNRSSTRPVTLITMTSGKWTDYKLEKE